MESVSDSSVQQKAEDDNFPTASAVAETRISDENQHGSQGDRKKRVSRRKAGPQCGGHGQVKCASLNSQDSCFAFKLDFF